MGKKFCQANTINRQPTGEFYRVIYQTTGGTEVGAVGEAVYYHGWGGIDLQFPNGTIVTFAIGDIEKV